MQTITEQLRLSLNKKVTLQALGNSHRSMKELAIDLIYASGLSYNTIAHGCFLHPTTVKNLAEEKTRNPQSETIERICRYFGVSLRGELVKVRAKYAVKPKKS